MNYTIKSGDTLSKIASMNGTTVAALMAANPSITNANLIRAGASISIPAVGTPSVSSVPAPPPNMTPAQQTAWNNAVSLIPSSAPAAGSVPPTQAQIDAATAAHPVTAPLVAKYGSAEAAWANAGGDISNMTDQYGTPFSQVDQQNALADSTAALDPYYSAEKAKETADAEAAMKQQQDAYAAAQEKDSAQFQADKTTLDQQAADSGVLFSGGRTQKLQTLGNAYGASQDTRANTLGYNIGNTARDFQYKYGNEAANNLSKYYTAPKNTYNTNVATGGVDSGGLSSIYNPAGSNFQGTQVNAAKAAAQTRAAGLLWNKGNKIVPLGYKNQY